MEQIGVISKIQTTPHDVLLWLWYLRQVEKYAYVWTLNHWTKVSWGKYILFQKWKSHWHNLQELQFFSKNDTNSDFWQIPLDPSSRLLITFPTPFGRFCYNKLPFGIASVPEHFQCRMNTLLEGLPCVVCHIDDILIYDKDLQEHNQRLTSTLNAIQQAGLTLNHEKCQFYKSSFFFLGHIVNNQGISPDPGKTRAIMDMKPPTTVTQLRRFLGMVTQMNWFSFKIAEFHNH